VCERECSVCGYVYMPANLKVQISNLI
jgi:rubredoxin